MWISLSSLSQLPPYLFLSLPPPILSLSLCLCFCARQRLLRCSLATPVIFVGLRYDGPLDLRSDAAPVTPISSERICHLRQRASNPRFLFFSLFRFSLSRQLPIVFPPWRWSVSGAASSRYGGDPPSSALSLLRRQPSLHNGVSELEVASRAPVGDRTNLRVAQPSQIRIFLLRRWLFRKLMIIYIFFLMAIFVVICCYIWM